MKAFLWLLFFLALATTARAQQWKAHGNGVDITITLLPAPEPGMPPLVSVTGVIEGQPVAGVGYLTRKPGDIWVANFIAPYLPPPENPTPGNGPPAKNPPKAPWVVGLDGKPSNSDVPGDQPAGEVSRPGGNTKKLYN